MLRDLFPYVLTALGTLFVAAVVQLAIVPRVESRKRREERWERDAVALAEFLEFDLAEARWVFVSSIDYWYWVVRDPFDPDDPTLPEQREQARQQCFTARNDLHRAILRARWLLSRVQAHEPRSLAAAKAAHELLKIDLRADDRYYELFSLSRDEVKELERDLREGASSAGTYARSALTRRPPPPDSRWRYRLERARLNTRQARLRLTRHYDTAASRSSRGVRTPHSL